MYKYKISMRVYQDGFYYMISTESKWIADEDAAFHESNEQVLYMQENHPYWETLTTTIKLYSGDCRYLRKTWNIKEFNWGV